MYTYHELIVKGRKKTFEKDLKKEEGKSGVLVEEEAFNVKQKVNIKKN